jgi:hypothetical protein
MNRAVGMYHLLNEAEVSQRGHFNWDYDSQIEHTRGMIRLSNLLRSRSFSIDRMSYTGWMNEATSSADFAGDCDFSSVDMLIKTIGGGKRWRSNCWIRLIYQYMRDINMFGQ